MNFWKFRWNLIKVEECHHFNQSKKLILKHFFCFRFSRSSGEGDGGEDSDPCSPYPYMPLDSHEDALTSPRRHSLPPFLSDPLFKLYTSMTSSDELPVIFHRQMSLAAAESKRRSSAVHELRRQNAELLTNLKVAQKRRFFAGSKINLILPNNMLFVK